MQKEGLLGQDVCENMKQQDVLRGGETKHSTLPGSFLRKEANNSKQLQEDPETDRL